MGNNIITDLILAGFADLINKQLAHPYLYTSAYKVGELVTYEGGLYRCISAVSADTAFDPTKWERIALSDRIWIGTTTELSTATISPGTIIIVTDDGQPYSAE